MSSLGEAVVTILTAIVGVAILSVLVSKKSNTVGVIGETSRAFGNALGIAVSPVTGAPVGGLSGSGNANGNSLMSMLNPPTISFQ